MFSVGFNSNKIKNSPVRLSNCFFYFVYALQRRFSVQDYTIFKLIQMN